MSEMGSAMLSTIEETALEEKVRAYKELGKKIEELEAQKKAIVDQILHILPKETKNVQIAEYQVKRISRLSIKTSLENAKLLGAVKTQEVIDRAKIKDLYEQGLSVPDVTEIQFIQVYTLHDRHL
jgi:hypothetical protein